MYKQAGLFLASLRRRSRSSRERRRQTEFGGGWERSRQLAQKPDAFGPLLKDVLGALRQGFQVDAEIRGRRRIGAHFARNRSRPVEHDEIVAGTGSIVQ